MRTAHRFIVSITAAAALLTGCNGMQSPIAAQDMTPQSRAHSATSSYIVLYRFDRYPNGEQPVAGLLNVGGVLYGTASNGGVKGCHQNAGCGTFFSITPKGAERLLYSFTERTGVSPQGRLIDVKDTLYGTAHQGGSSAKGTVYTITTSGLPAVLYNFLGTGDGAYPDAGVTYIKGTFYGTNTYGGGHHRDGGTAYSVMSSGMHTVLHAFKGGSDGYDPEGGLINLKGRLYGTTAGGGTGCNNGGCGTVYSMTTSGTITILYRFTGGSDGASPRSDLLNVNGLLYGTTLYGGSGTGCGGLGCGTVFSVTTSGKEKVLYRFTGGSDGAYPIAALVDVNGTLYGTTAGGGAGCSSNFGCGVVYSLTTSGTETVLHAFTGGTDGDSPRAPLTAVKGTLYGTTVAGGDPQVSPNCCGTIFAVKP